MTMSGSRSADSRSVLKQDATQSRRRIRKSASSWLRVFYWGADLSLLSRVGDGRWRVWFYGLVIPWTEIAIGIVARERVDLLTAAARLLRDVPGVDAAYLLTGTREDTIYVIAQEHGIVDHGVLIDIESDLRRNYGQVDISVRAHQGRDPDTMFAKEDRLNLGGSR